VLPFKCLPISLPLENFKNRPSTEFHITSRIRAHILSVAPPPCFSIERRNLRFIGGFGLTFDKMDSFVERLGTLAGHIHLIFDMNDGAQPFKPYILFDIQREILESCPLSGRSRPLSSEEADAA